MSPDVLTFLVGMACGAGVVAAALVLYLVWTD